MTVLIRSPHAAAIVGAALTLALGLAPAPRQLAAQTDAPAAQPPSTDAPDAADDGLAQQFAAFGKLLSGSTLQGHFTVDGQQDGLKEERYEIQSVSKLPAGDIWLFKVRIRYGDHDVNVPLPLKVSWADKTPVIVVDQLNIPGLGTFDARVVIADQRYAGTWQHGDVGGHLFGQIVPAADDKPPTAEAAEQSGDAAPRDAGAP